MTYCALFESEEGAFDEMPSEIEAEYTLFWSSRAIEKEEPKKENPIGTLAVKVEDLIYSAIDAYNANKDGMNSSEKMLGAFATFLSVAAMSNM